MDCSPSLSGLLDRFITHFFLMMSGTGVFLYLGCCCRWLNFFICQLFVILNTFSLDLYITSVISLKSLLLHLFFKFSLILFMWDSNFLIILLQYLTQLFRMDLWVLQMIFLSWNVENCLMFSFTHFGTIFWLRHLRLKCRWHLCLASFCSFPSQLLTSSIQLWPYLWFNWLKRFILMTWIYMW